MPRPPTVQDRPASVRSPSHLLYIDNLRTTLITFVILLHLTITYAAYLIHEPIIATAALAITGVALYPLLKFVLMALVTVPLTFLLSALIRKIPCTDRVL